MKALSIPASRSGKSVNFQAVLAAVRNTLSPKSLTRLALFCAIVVYVALIIGAQTVMFAAGITAILAVWAAEEISARQKKGGDR